MYSLDDLLLFFKVVEFGNFTNAASHLKIAQSTVSRRIKNLEDNLKITLIKRNSSKFEITREGYNLFNSAAYALNNIHNIIEETQEINAAIKGDLKVALPPYLSYELISSKLIDFLVQYPEINLHVSFTNADLNMLDSGFDVAVINHLPNQSSQKIRFLLSAEAKLYCTQAYASRYGVPEKIEDIAKHLITGVVSYNSKSRLNTIQVSHRITGETFTVNMPNRIRTNDSLQSNKIVQTDNAIVALYDFSQESQNKDLIAVLHDYKIFSINYYLMKHNTDKSMKTKVFCDFIFKCIKER